MKFQVVEKLFFRAKQIISIINFVFLALSVVFFLYWLIICARVNVPQPINSFFGFFTEYAAQFMRSSSIYENLVLLLPIIYSCIFVFLTYVMSYALTYLEIKHREFLAFQERYKKSLEEKINAELKKAFIAEISQAKFLLIKLKIEASIVESFLRNFDDTPDVDKIQNEISKKIIDNLNDSFFSKKIINNGIIYLVNTNLKLAPELFIDLVNVSINTINQYISERYSLKFYCVAEIFNDESEFAEKSAVIDKILNLKIQNRIVIQPKFKTYFDEMDPESFMYKLIGEYNEL